MRPQLPRIALACLLIAVTACRAGDPAVIAPPSATMSAIDRDLLDVTVPRLQELYAQKRYTVRQVVEWHLARIDRYNGVYGAIETVLRDQALAEASRLDSLAAAGAVTKGPLWGVPIIIKANTSVAGQITTAGWAGFSSR